MSHATSALSVILAERSFLLYPSQVEAGCCCVPWPCLHPNYSCEGAQGEQLRGNIHWSVGKDGLVNPYSRGLPTAEANRNMNVLIRTGKYANPAASSGIFSYDLEFFKITGVLSKTSLDLVCPKHLLLLWYLVHMWNPIFVLSSYSFKNTYTWRSNVSSLSIWCLNMSDILTGLNSLTAVQYLTRCARSLKCVFGDLFWHKR